MEDLPLEDEELAELLCDMDVAFARADRLLRRKRDLFASWAPPESPTWSIAAGMLVARLLAHLPSDTERVSASAGLMVRYAQIAKLTDTAVDEHVAELRRALAAT